MRVSVIALRHHLHATPFTVGVLMALYALLPMLSAVSMGRLIDASASRVPMLIGSVAIALGALVPSCGPTLTALHLTSVLIGSGFMMYQGSPRRTSSATSDARGSPMTFSLAAWVLISGFVGRCSPDSGSTHSPHRDLRGIRRISLLPITVLD